MTRERDHTGSSGRPRDHVGRWQGWRVALVPAGLLLFVLLATLNSAGYRYGASDQAFYVPAATLRLHPAFYPRDAALIDSQARLTLVDETTAALSRVTGASLPALFAGLYVITLVLLALAAVRIGRFYYRSTWATLALAAALTLRHGIATTGTNTLEGYFHPRQLAFALGVWGLALFLRGRGTFAAFIAGAGVLVHPTTTAWFAVWLAVAMSVTHRRFRAVAVMVAVMGGIAAAWAVTAGPLAGRMTVMDQAWLATLETKDYLFPLEWPTASWVVNLSYPILIAALYVRRRQLGLVTTPETGLVAGAAALLVMFLASVPFNAARMQLAIQLQPARIFWMLDFLATIYVLWGLAEGGAPSPRRARMVLAILCAFSMARGTYLRFVAFPDRTMFAVGLPAGDWTRVMEWARHSPVASHWLADPKHASRYGTSLRVAGERDVLVEASKDQAIGMYDRAVAMRTRDRIAAVGDFQTLTAERARALASAYGLDYVVTEESLALPVAFASGALKIYALR